MGVDSEYTGEEEMAMNEQKYVGYLRVSTDKQGRSGLGLQSQEQIIHDTVKRNNWTLLQQFVEVESGKSDTNRSQLKAALEMCERTGAKLLVAKLDRLSRDLAFIANLMKTKTQFVACDFPEANTFTIHILSAMAEYERRLISERTKAALITARSRGTKLGNPKNLTKQHADRGRKLGTKARQQNADEFAKRLSPVIKGYLDEGLSLNGIARRLKRGGVLSATGKANWTPTGVKHVINRMKI